MDELLLDDMVVRKLNDELSAGESWKNCTLIARPRAKGCSLQLKFGKRTASIDTFCLVIIVKIRTYVYVCMYAFAYNSMYAFAS